MSARRPVLLAVAAVVGAWSLWIVSKGDDGSAVVTASERAPRNAVRSNEIRAPQAVPPGNARAAAEDTDAAPANTGPGREPRFAAVTSGQANAFSVRDWLPPPPPPPKTVVAPVQVVAAPVDVAPPPPPLVLPYRFIGMLDDPQSTAQRVFLAIGDKLIVASIGEVLDGGFRLDTIRATELVFTHVQQGRTVRLPLAGAPS